MSAFEPKGMNREEWAFWNENRIREWEMKKALGMRNAYLPIPGDEPSNQIPKWPEPGPAKPTAWTQFLELIGWGKR